MLGLILWLWFSARCASLPFALYLYAPMEGRIIMIYHFFRLLVRRTMSLLLEQCALRCTQQKRTLLDPKWLLTTFILLAHKCASPPIQALNAQPFFL